MYVSRHTQNVKKKQIILLMIPNGEGWYYIKVKSRGVNQNKMMIIIVLVVSIHLERKILFIKKYVKIKTFVTL